MANSTSQEPATTEEYVSIDGDTYFRIENSHLMPEFFMSLVGADDHWMFVSSRGAITAGRRDPDTALFPYASDDQISNSQAHNGPMTLVRPLNETNTSATAKAWEPFASLASTDFRCKQNLYKTPLGNKLVFEEVNESLQLAFRYRWTFSRKFGFVRSCRLENTGPNPQSLELLDGLANVLPYGVGSEFLMRFSNLANAYKKSECVPNSKVGLFYLSSVPTDRAEPSEGLKTTSVWQTGLAPNAILLSPVQVEAFRAGDSVATESTVRGATGAFLLNQSIELGPGESIEWHVVAELAQDHCSIVALDEWLQNTDDPTIDLFQDIRESEEAFLRVVSSSDGIQRGANQRRSNRHLSNTVFNVMRGGLPLRNYDVDTRDFHQHVKKFNQTVHAQHQSFFNDLPSTISAMDLRAQIADRNDPDFTRLGMEYLPLAFSRRHGDPTRPWNRFSINLRSDDGSASLNYEGNWRDIFQNWEALAISFPGFSSAMICRFVNATTADGYNPYRLTKDGFEWEEPTPDDPWANIGYWGDHQIIYLLKLIEWTQRFQPASLNELLNAPLFAYADVPYRIKPYAEIKKDGRDTIELDAEASVKIAERVKHIGADGKLLHTTGPNGQDEIHRVTLLEKLLTLSLAKLSNFIPDGGIWLNTQRPEWNDANNALVGNGLSMVTTCYLHRWFQFLSNWVSDCPHDSFQVSQPVADFFTAIGSILQRLGDQPSETLAAVERLNFVDALSNAGCKYRKGLYERGLGHASSPLSKQDCVDFFTTAQRQLETTIRNNRRPDGLYHAYNLLDWKNDDDNPSLEIENLYAMLEGQVAILSSGLLTAQESLELLDALRSSSLYRENQNSYLLYPDRQLPGFMEKNLIDEAFATANPLVQKLLASHNERIVSRDVRGDIHFNGTFRNSSDLSAAIASLGGDFAAEVQSSALPLVERFEELFGHRQFTGRSGTFFAYEGLGSIYWHMVSKLLLAVSENFFHAIDSNASPELVASLRAHYYEIRSGIGAEKQPVDYGAFPSDPYSHTPENAGVKQPGMTGQVKEDILSRFSELGMHVENGCLKFRMELFDRDELAAETSSFTYADVEGEFQTIDIPANGFGFTLFQVPFILHAGDKKEIEEIRIMRKDGSQTSVSGLALDAPTSQELFSRRGTIVKIECQFAI